MATKFQISMILSRKYTLQGDLKFSIMLLELQTCWLSMPILFVPHLAGKDYYHSNFINNNNNNILGGPK